MLHKPGQELGSGDGRDLAQVSLPPGFSAMPDRDSPDAIRLRPQNLDRSLRGRWYRGRHGNGAAGGHRALWLALNTVVTRSTARDRTRSTPAADRLRAAETILAGFGRAAGTASRTRRPSR